MRECLREIGSGAIIPLNQNGTLRRYGDIPSDVSRSGIFQRRPHDELFDLINHGQLDTDKRKIRIGMMRIHCSEPDRAITRMRDTSIIRQFRVQPAGAHVVDDRAFSADAENHVEHRHVTLVIDAGACTQRVDGIGIDRV